MHGAVGQALLYPLDLHASAVHQAGHILLRTSSIADTPQQSDSDTSVVGSGIMNVVDICPMHVQCMWSGIQGSRVVGEATRHAHLEAHDLLDLAQLQRLEDHELVHAVHKLRAEVRMHLRRNNRTMTLT